MRTQVFHGDGQMLCEAPTAPRSIALPATRIANIDRLRILAAIGIVWFHTDGAPYRNVGYAGLPIFLLIFCSLLTLHGFEGTTKDFLKRRCCRLLKPWLFWSVVYGLCRLGKSLHTTDIGSLWEMVSAETLLAGTSIHLWYLPYAFLSGIVIRGLNRWTSRVATMVVIAAATTVGVALLAIHATGTWNQLTRPLPQWEFGLSAIALGIAVGKCLTIPSRDLQRWLLVGIALIVAVEYQILHQFGFGSQVLPHAIGVVLMCIAYGWGIRSDSVVAALAPLTFGVYLIHPLVAQALQRVPAMKGHFVVFILATVCVSALATQILMKTPLKRFV